MVTGLRGDDLLLQAHQKLLCLQQGQAKIRDLAKIPALAKLHHVNTASCAVSLGFDQTHNPSHPRSPTRHRSERSYIAFVLIPPVAGRFRSTRRRSDGGTEYFHTFLGASIVAPGHKQVLPLPPEFIASQDGAEKQDCERNAAKRWLAKHGATVAHLRPVFLGDDLFACQPIAAAIQAAGGNFILTCKSSSHKTIAEYLRGGELHEHRQTVCKRGKRATTVYRWLEAVPLRATEDAITVNWFSIETFNAKGKRTYYNSFVTDLPITPDTVAELAACGRARWKIENETFNVLKTNGYNLEHNFGHGKQTLASVLVTLNLLAFAFHTAAYLGVLAWRTAVIARGPAYRFFEHLRTITVYVVFQDWPHLLQSIAAAAVRPP
jgi:hypothetical protein